MNKEFIPYEEAMALKELGFKEKCAAHYLDIDDLELKWEIYRNLSINTSDCIQAPTFSQAFRFFREKYNLHFSIGVTNICVYHVPVSNYYTTGMIQDSKTYDEAELQCLKKFIETVKYNPHLWQNL